MNINKIKSFLPYIVPTVIVLVASLQFYLVNTYSLVQWKGGGFGMFSTVDSQRSRFLKFYLITDEGEFPAEIPNDLDRLYVEASFFPASGRLSRLATILAQSTWVPYDYQGFVQENRKTDPPQYRIKRSREPDPQGDDVVNLRAVRLEAWSFGLNLENKALEAYMIADFTLDVTR